MMMDRADLHTHSTISDGTVAPSGIVRMAGEVGLLGISLTDHDSIDGLMEFMNAVAPRHLQRIPGLEISTSYNGKEAHLLGYFVPMNSSHLFSKLQWLRDARETRFPKMLYKLSEMGINVEKEYLDSLLDGVKSPGRPHIGRILIEKGVVQTMDEAFDRFLGKGCPLYVEKEKMNVDEAISLLRSVGAVPVLAHPLTIRDSRIYDVLVEMKDMGLMGVEVLYDYAHFQIQEEPSEVIKASDKIGLIKTGGTDYHGPGWRVPIGGVSVSIEVVDELRDASENLGGEPDAWVVDE